MSHSDSLADEHLLRLIRDGDQDGWAQFVGRYEGRMVAFAKGQVRQDSDAEDLVQDAFLGFLGTLKNFREQSTLETWLFRILRRRIVDHYRRRGSNQEIAACAFGDEPSPSNAADPIAVAVDPGESPSLHVEQLESQSEDERSLSIALHQVIDHMKQESNLRDLMIVEGIFYAVIRNRDLASLIDVEEGTIAVVRHRVLKRIRDRVAGDDQAESSVNGPLPSSDLLTRIWDRDRPSCPKRTTLGKSLLGILDEPWQRYIHFHVDQLGCRFCVANRQDLSRDELNASESARCERIFQSTIGFISRPRSQ